MSMYNKKIQIILINTIVFIICFFLYKNSSLELNQGIIFFITTISSINLVLIRYKIIKLLSIPFFFWSWWLLLLGYFPLYQQSPNLSNFYLNQQIKYLCIGDYENIEITDITTFWKQKIIPKDNFVFLSQQDERKLLISQKDKNNKDFFVIQFPDNTIYIAYPWTQIDIKKEWKTYIITKEYWRSEFYIPENQKTKINNLDIKEQKSEEDFTLWYLIKNYEENKKEFIINQWWWFLLTQPFYQKISKNILDIAYLFRPKIYEKNLKNYDQYKEFLWRKEFTKDYTKEENRRKLIQDQIKKSKEQTRFLN